MSSVDDVCHLKLIKNWRLMIVTVSLKISVYKTVGSINACKINVWILRCIIQHSVLQQYTWYWHQSPRKTIPFRGQYSLKKHIAVFYWITNTVQIHELKDTNRRGILRYTSYPSEHTTMFSFKTLHWQFDTVYFNMYTYSLTYICFTYTWLDLFKGDKINVETQISKMQKEVGGVMSFVVEKVN